MSIPKVNPSTLADRIKLAEASQRPMLLRGGPGVGKSDIFRQHAERRATERGGNLWRGAGNDVGEKSYGYLDSRVLYFDPTDLKGFPLVDRENKMSHWMAPGYFPLQRNVDAGRVPSQGMWNFEELPSAAPAVQAATYQVMLDREINGEPIAPGWFLVATGNKLSDRGVVNRLPSPLVSRFWHLELCVSVEEWAAWAMTANINPLLVAFYRFRPELLNSFDPKKWEQDTPYSCPRSAHMLSDLLWANGSGKWPLDVIHATVGETVGNEMYAYLDIIRDLPSVDSILLDPDKAIMPEATAALYAISAALARRINAGNSPKIFKYTLRMAKEFQVNAIRDFARTCPEVQETRDFTAWALANADIFTY
jgi:hypothetical protein